MKFLNNIYLLKFLSIFFVLLTIFGILINYSSIPQADMWSNFELIYELKHKNYQYLFSQHNEHRIIIPRLLYLLDSYVFKNGYYLLYFFNISLFFIICYFLNRFFRENYFSKKYDLSWFFFTLGILFFWGQKSNFIWAYQSQFLLAYLFPILSIYFISKININYYLSLFLSILFAFFGIGTMANGLFILPVIFLYLFFNSRINESLLILFICLISFVLYFYNFSAVNNHADLSNIFFRLHNILIFYLVLSGNFFSFMVGKGIFGIFFAGSLGFIINFFLLVLLFKNFKVIKKDYLIYILLFIVISLLSIAAGRENLGLKSAISSRYITPAVIFFCISLFYFFKYSLLNQNNLRKFFILILIALTPYQLTALKNNNDKNIKDLSKVVSFMMGIDNNIPHFNLVSDTAYFINNDILIFSEPLIKFIEEKKDTEKSYCNLQNINDFQLLELNDNTWDEIRVDDINLKRDFYRLLNKDREYIGLIYHTSLVENLIYSNNFYMGYVMSNINQQYYYCK